MKFSYPAWFLFPFFLPILLHLINCLSLRMLLVHGCLKLIMSNSYPSVGLPYFGAHNLESFNFLGYEVLSKLGRCHTCIGVGIFFILNVRE